MYLRYWNQELKSMSKQQPINEGPEWGAESASTYKADTPGQENADQVPKTEETPEPDQIQKLVDIVAKRIMGLKESIVRYGTDWNNISKFINAFDENGIDYLVEMCENLNFRKGKPLRELFEDVNLDEFLDEEDLDEATLGGEKYKGKENPNNKMLKGPGVDKRAKDAFAKHDDKSFKQAGRRLAASITAARMSKNPDKNMEVFKDAGHKMKRHMQGAAAAKRVGNVKEETVDEAMLGGKKYEGKENPNNKKLKGPGVDTRAKLHYNHHSYHATRETDKVAQASKEISKLKEVSKLKDKDLKGYKTAVKKNSEIVKRSMHRIKRSEQGMKAANRVGNVQETHDYGELDVL